MIQLVVTMDNAIFDPLKSTMDSLKAVMLQTYAKEMELESEMQYRQHFTYTVVEGENANISQLVFKLRNKGCLDIHVYSEDEQELRWLQGEHGNLFRYVNLKFKA